MVFQVPRSPSHSGILEVVSLPALAQGKSFISSSPKPSRCALNDQTNGATEILGTVPSSHPRWTGHVQAEGQEPPLKTVGNSLFQGSWALELCFHITTVMYFHGNLPRYRQ